MNKENLTANMFCNYSNLGTFNPYYYIGEDGSLVICNSLNDSIDSFKGNLQINGEAIGSILGKNFMLGDQTIVKGIFRSPWLARPDIDKKGWVYYSLPKHKENKESEEVVAQTLFELLCEEILEYTRGKETIGVLLSGGMDSRMLAGTLDYLIKRNIISPIKVVAYTWGNETSRDIIYAKEIASRLGWEWKSYQVNSDDLWENFILAGQRGCEYSGVHLHAMPKIARDSNVEVLLAGSYGDSVGRAEYSGQHVSKLIPIENGVDNFNFILKNSVKQQVKGKCKNDVKKYHNLFPENWKYAQIELDYQLHYMRRMLNPCMEVLNDKIPVFQMFTSPKVYSYMWSLCPSVRNNHIYTNLMKLFYTDLFDIPWARTGIIYGSTGIPDRYEKQHHSYPQIISTDLLRRMGDRINDYLPNNQMLNKNSVQKVINLLRRDKYAYRHFDYLERISWVVSFTYFLEKFNDRQEIVDYSSDSMDKFISHILLPSQYFLTHVYRSSLKSKFFD